MKYTNKSKNSNKISYKNSSKLQSRVKSKTNSSKSSSKHNRLVSKITNSIYNKNIDNKSINNKSIESKTTFKERYTNKESYTNSDQVQYSHKDLFVAPAGLNVGQEYRTPVVTLDITNEEQDRRVDNFLISILPNVPKSNWYKLLRKGEIRVNKKRIKPEYKLQVGDQLRIAPLTLVVQNDKNLSLESAVNLDSVKELAKRIVYEDKGMIIIDKPVGIAVHGGSGLSYGVIEALRFLMPKEKKLELVHRIDRETSGLLIIAKKNSYLKHLQEQFRAKTIQKSYYCLVPGVWSCKQVNKPLHRYEKQGERFVEVSELGKPSVTDYKVVDYLSDDKGNISSLLIAKPRTGRTHQIRVHCMDELAALAGDQKYANLNELAYYKNLGLKRMFLHAFKLEFNHPESNERKVVEIPLNRELQNLVDKLYVVDK